MTNIGIFFICDQPHTHKIARNNIAHSGFGGKSSRLLWNDGYYIIWDHISKLITEDLEYRLVMPEGNNGTYKSNSVLCYECKTNSVLCYECKTNSVLCYECKTNSVLCYECKTNSVLCYECKTNSVLCYECKTNSVLCYEYKSVMNVKLTLYSVMNVKLAAQVLSTSVSTALKTFGARKVLETAKYCEMFDSFF